MNKLTQSGQEELDIVEQFKDIVLKQYPSLKDLITTLKMIDWIYRFGSGAFGVFELRFGPATNAFTYKYKIEFYRTSTHNFQYCLYEGYKGEDKQPKWSISLTPEQMFQKLICLIGTESE